MSAVWADDAQTMFAASVERFVTQTYTFEHRRHRLKTGDPDRRDWRQIAELGWLGLPFPEDVGGFGGSWQDVALLMRYFGRALVVEPYLPGVVLSGGLIASLGDGTQRQRYLPPLIDGSVQLALAHETGTLRARAEGDGLILQGHAAMVWGGATAEAFVVAARLTGDLGQDTDDIAIAVVECDSPGLAVTGFPTVDGHQAASIRLTDVRVPPDRLLTRDGARALNWTLDLGAAMVCAEGIGVMDVLFEDTLAYLKDRRQFGKPLASHQALQHRLVDMHALWQEAVGMAAMAVQALDAPGTRDDVSAREMAISSAKVHVAGALRQLGQEAVQLHGAIGVTDEFHISHYFKRATSLSLQHGDIDHHRRRCGELLKRHHTKTTSP